MPTTARTLPILLLALALSACAGTGGSIVQRERPRLGTRPESATLVLIRPTSYGWGVTIDNFLDGKLIGRTRGKSYFVAQIAPGTHYLMARAENISVARLAFEAGKIYFIHEAILPGFWKARTMLSTLPLQEGLQKADDPDCDLRLIDPESAARDLPANDYEEARRDFEKEVVTEPARHRESLEYRGFVMPGSPMPVAAPLPAAAPLAPSLTGAARCSKDVDCAGNDVCQGGTCVAPPGAPAAAPPPAAQPAPAAPPRAAPPPAGPVRHCAFDRECPGTDQCQGGVCVTPPRRCSKDLDCLGDDICEAGFCHAPH